MDAHRVERIYSLYSGVYDLIFGGVLKPRIGETIQAMGIKEGDRVLEVGVGTGLSLPYYPRHCTVTGIDLSRKMILKASEKAKSLNLSHISLKVMNAESLSFQDEAFDHVFAAFVITTVPNPRRVLSEMARVLKKGARIVLVNHFRSAHPFIGRMEDLLSPLFIRLGWRTDLCIDDILDASSLTVSSVCKVNRLDPWKIFFLEKNSAQ